MKVLITGANGNVAKAVIKCLLKKNQNCDLQLVLIVRDKSKFEKWCLENGIKHDFIAGIYELDVIDERLLEIEHDLDYIIHCASSTQSRIFIEQPIEVADGIVLGTRNILELAEIQRVKGMVYVSSMEVYGQVSDKGETFKEEEIGYVSLAQNRSCYPLAKRMAEHYCYIYAQERNVPVKIARLAQTFGGEYNPQDKRVYMQMAEAILERKNIVLKTQGMSMGNYCAIDDVAEAILLIMEKGENGETYNVVNEKNCMSVKDMAERVINKFGDGNIKVEYSIDEREKRKYAPDTNLRMSSEKLRKLGWASQKSLDEMYADLFREMRVENKSSG